VSPAARALANAYPPPVRERWGDELAAEIAGGGPWAWPDAVLGAVRLWLRPGQWPARTGGQLRRAVVVLAFLAVAVAALSARGLAPWLGVPGGDRSQLPWLATVSLGVLVLAPLPRRPVRSFLRAVLVPFVPGGLLLAAMLALARVPVTATGAVRVLLLTGYWTALVAMAAAPVAAVCRLDPATTVIPGRRRAEAGLVAIALGLAGGGLANTWSDHGPTSRVFGAALLVLAALTAAGLTDLRRSPLLD